MDPYKTLGVSKTATEDEIKKNYRKIAKDNHPDRFPGDKMKAEIFSNAAQAYEILTDNDKKRAYDKHGDAEKADFGNIFKRKSLLQDDYEGMWGEIVVAGIKLEGIFENCRQIAQKINRKSNSNLIKALSDLLQLFKERDDIYNQYKELLLEYMGLTKDPTYQSLIVDELCKRKDDTRGTLVQSLLLAINEEIEQKIATRISKYDDAEEYLVQGIENAKYNTTKCILIQDYAKYKKHNVKDFIKYLDIAQENGKTEEIVVKKILDLDNSQKNIVLCIEKVQGIEAKKTLIDAILKRSKFYNDEVILTKIFVYRKEYELQKKIVDDIVSGTISIKNSVLGKDIIPHIVHYDLLEVILFYVIDHSNNEEYTNLIHQVYKNTLHTTLATGIQRPLESIIQKEEKLLTNYQNEYNKIELLCNNVQVELDLIPINDIENQKTIIQNLINQAEKKIKVLGVGQNNLINRYSMLHSREKKLQIFFSKKDKKIQYKRVSEELEKRIENNLLDQVTHTKNQVEQLQGLHKVKSEINNYNTLKRQKQTYQNELLICKKSIEDCISKIDTRSSMIKENELVEQNSIPVTS